MQQMIHATRHQHRIQWALATMLLALLGAILVSLVVDERERLLQREGKRLLDQARLVDDNISRQLAGVRAALDGVRNDMAHFAPDGLQVAGSRQLKALSAAMPGVRTLLVIGPQGDVLASNRAELLGSNFGERPYFQNPKNRPQLDTLYVSEPFTTRLNVYSLVLAKISTDAHGSFAGIVTASISR